MNITRIKSLLSFKKRSINKRSMLPIIPELTLETLENRVLLSVLDYAGEIVQESVWDNVGPEQIQEGEAKGIQGRIDYIDETDQYMFRTMGEGFDAGEGELDITMDLTEGVDLEITALAAGGDGVVYFVADNHLWLMNAADADSPASLVATRSSLATFTGFAEPQITISDMAVTPEGNALVVFAGEGEIVQVDSAGNMEEIVTAEEILVVTADIGGIDDDGNDLSVDLTAIAVDAASVIYAADGISGSVLQITPQEGTDYEVGFYLSGKDLTEGIQNDIFDDVTVGSSIIPQVVIADQEDSETNAPVFAGNSLITGSGVYGRPGYDVYYVSQLGGNFGLEGTINRVEISRTDPEDVTISSFFDPEINAVNSIDPMDENDINPSALAQDTAGIFGSRMFLGSFGPSLGDDLDGKLYGVDASGDMTEIALSFVDRDGNPVIRDGLPVDSFFDVTDMAFSYGGEFGEYLYILSENIDANGAAAGGHTSDLWRVSLTGPDADEGVAELFVPDIGDGAITLAFSDQADWRYGGDLYIGTFRDGGRIYQIDSEGQKELFYSFGSINTGFAIADFAFSPYLDDIDSPMEGSLIVTVRTLTGEASLVQLNPDVALGQTTHFWGHELNIGDISSGDLVYTDLGDLVINAGGDNNLTRIDYQNAFDYTFEDIQIRTLTQEFEEDNFDPDDPVYIEVTTHTPYILMTVGGQPRIINLGEADVVADIATEVSPGQLNFGDTPDDESSIINFTFADSGDIYLYTNNTGQLLTASRDDSVTPTKENPGVPGLYVELSQELSAGDIADETDLVGAQIFGLAWAADGSLYAIGRNEVAFDGGPSANEFDDALVLLLNTDNFQGTESRVDVKDLTRMELRIAGPGVNDLIFEVSPSEPLTIKNDARLRGLAAGVYTLTITPQTPAAAHYELLISSGFEEEVILVVEAGTPLAERVLSDRNGGEMVISYTGPGAATLTYKRNSNGSVVELTELTIENSHKRSVLLFENDDINGWALDEFALDAVTFNGSISRVFLPFDVETVKAVSGSRGNIYSFETLGRVRNVELGEYNIVDFIADSLGDDALNESDTQPQFEAGMLRNLSIGNGNGGINQGNISNVIFLEGDTKNRYRSITVEGIIEGSAFSGLAIDRLLVENRFGNLKENPLDTQGDPINIAMDSSVFNLNTTHGFLRDVKVERGDVFGSLFNAGKMVHDFIVEEGSLSSTQIATTRIIGNVAVRGHYDPRGENDTGGNVTSSVISTSGKLVSFYAAGSVDENSTIAASGLISSTIHTVITGGDFAGNISSTRVFNVYVGFNENLERLQEDELNEDAEFIGSHFTGQISSFLSIHLVNVTGYIAEATLSTTHSHIRNIFAEDGVFDTEIDSGRAVGSIIVGYMNGRRDLENIVNPNAGVDGSISAGSLARIYYTGQLGVDLAGVGKVGVLRDDTPTMSVTVDYAALEEADRLITAEDGSQQILEGDEGILSIPLIFRLDQLPMQPVSLEYKTVSFEADDTDIVVADNAVLTFQKFQNRLNLDLPLIRGDMAFENNESFALVFENEFGLALGVEELDFVIADDDESPVVNIGDDVFVVENDDGTQTVQVDVSVAVNAFTDETVTVVYETVDNTATAADGDYETILGFLEFDTVNGPLTQTVSVTVNGDQKFEGDESFSLWLMNVINGEIGEQEAEITIENDDNGFSIDDVVVEELHDGTTDAVFTVTLTLGDPADLPLSVSYATVDNTATVADNDYIAKSGTLTFNSQNSLSKTIRIKVVGDENFEQITNDQGTMVSESFFVVLSNAAGNVDIAKTQGQGTITDDDVSIDVTDADIVEGDAGTKTAVFNVVMIPSLSARGSVSFAYETQDGTATTSDNDYEPASGLITFAPDDPLTKTIEVIINGDVILEEDETFNLELSGITSGIDFNNTLTALSILNDD